MFFEVAEHFFNPHPASIKPQNHTWIRQIGSQAPGFFFSDLPMNQQIDRINLLDRQIAHSQPETLARFLDISAELLPTALFAEPDACIGFLTQDIEPAPLIQLAQDCHGTKFPIPNQKDGGSGWKQFPHIGQQSHLFARTPLPFDMLNPGTDDRDGTFPVSQADDQQLMPKADFRAIHNQMNFSEMSELR